MRRIIFFITIVFNYGSDGLAGVGATLAAPIITLETQKSYPNPSKTPNPKLIASCKIISQILGLGLYCNFAPFLPAWLVVVSVGMLFSWPTGVEIITQNSDRFFRILEFLSIFLIVSVGYLAHPVYLFLCNLTGVGIALLSKPEALQNLIKRNGNDLPLAMGVLFTMISGIGLIKGFLPFILSLVFVPTYWLLYGVLCLTILVSFSQEIEKLRNTV